MRSFEFDSLEGRWAATSLTRPWPKPETRSGSPLTLGAARGRTRGRASDREGSGGTVESVSNLVEFVSEHLDFTDPRFADVEEIYAEATIQTLRNPTGSVYRAYTALLAPSSHGDAEALERAATNPLPFYPSEVRRVGLAAVVLDLWGETPRACARSDNRIVRRAAAASAGLDPADAAWLLREELASRAADRSPLLATLCLNPATPDRIARKAATQMRLSTTPEATAVQIALAWRRDGWPTPGCAERVRLADAWLVGAAFDRLAGGGEAIAASAKELTSRLIRRYEWFVESDFVRAATRDPALLAPGYTTHRNWTVRTGTTVDELLSLVAAGRGHEALLVGRETVELVRRARAIAEALGEDPAAHRIFCALGSTWMGSEEDLLATVEAVQGCALAV